MNEFRVSVVIPVYNASPFIEEAVQSAISLPETGEVILIDDGSSDDSLEICKRLADQYHNIILLRHPGGKNLGAAASRNAGIEASKFDYISFLDADDYYLPNRFEQDRHVFLSDSEADGVYGCNQAVFENDLAREKFLSRYPGENTTLSEALPPEKLFHALLLGGYGRFHTSAITLHKRAFSKAGLFNTNIRYVEDTEFWLKLSIKAKLLPGSITTPVSVRRVHDTNSIHQVNKVEVYTRMMYQSLFDWAINQPFDFAQKNDFFIALYQFVYGNGYSASSVFWDQVRRNPVAFISWFGIKKMHQIYFR